MGAGVSSNSTNTTKPILRTVFVCPSKCSPPPHDNTSTAYLSPSKSPLIDDDANSPSAFMFTDKTLKGQWQMEEEMGGRWISLPSVNSGDVHLSALAGDRIEIAYCEGRVGVTCTLNNRIGVVDFTTMRLMFSSSSSGAEGKRIRRVNALLGGSKSVSDPFAFDDVAPAVPIVGGDDGSGAEGGESKVEDNGTYTAELTTVIYAHNAPIFSSCFSVDGTSVLSAAKDGSAKYWETETSFVRQDFEKIQSCILNTALSKTALLAATACDDHTVRVYQLNDRNSSAAQSRGEDSLHTIPKAQLFGHVHKVYGVGFTRDGRTLISTSMDKTLRCWDVNTLKMTRVVQCHSGSIFNQSVSPLNPWLVLTASDDCTLAAHDLRVSSRGGGATGGSSDDDLSTAGSSVVRRFEGHTRTLWGCDIRYDEMQYISCGMDNKVMMWDPRQEKGPVQTISSHTHPVHCVEYMPDGSQFLSSSRDKSFRVTDCASGATCLSRVAHEGHVFRVTFNAMTDTVMTCGADSRIKLWSLKRKI